MTETERTDLAKERTHAAWLRTSLAFLVALVALLHYLPDGDGFGYDFLGLSLTLGGCVSGGRAASYAPDWSTRLTAYAVQFAPAAAVVVFG